MWSEHLSLSVCACMCETISYEDICLENTCVSKCSACTDRCQCIAVYVYTYWFLWMNVCVCVGVIRAGQLCSFVFSPQGTSRPSHWLEIRGVKWWKVRTRKSEEQWQRSGRKLREREVGSPSLCKQFVNVFNPFKQVEKPGPCINVSLQCAFPFSFHPFRHTQTHTRLHPGNEIDLPS